ncbi:MAG: septal ring lytic transglycosylase RlpA family protein [Granulosicoccus sp.]
MSRYGITLPLAMATTLILSACAASTPQPAWKAAVAGDGPGDPALLPGAHAVKVSNLPKSRSGNRPSYEVFGVRYEVLEHARDFRERGVASWYGSKFHGNATASGEIYDMHQLTAAHKHLPLPTFVRVTRMDNGLSIVVKVNDRGPFVGDRIIDLSYAAAAKLGMLEGGKADVLVEALSHHEEAASVDPESIKSAQTGGFSNLQVGAFSERSNAEALQAQIVSATALPVFVEFVQSRLVYRVLVGPLSAGESVERAQKQLVLAGMKHFQLSKSVR